MKPVSLFEVLGAQVGVNRIINIPGLQCRCEYMPVKGDIRFAVIDTKLNLIIAIMAFLGAAVGGVVVSMLFA